MGLEEEELSGGTSLLARGPTASETPLHLEVFPGKGWKAEDTKSDLILFLAGQALAVCPLASCWYLCI